MEHTDWEAIADRDPNELLSPSSLPEVSNLSLQDSKVQAPKRRGRGAFLYQKYGLYSDEQSEGRKFDYLDDDVSDSTEGSSHSLNCKFMPLPLLKVVLFSLILECAYADASQ